MFLLTSNDNEKSCNESVWKSIGEASKNSINIVINEIELH